MHYPLTLKYEDDDIFIDNRYILNCISKSISDYAFIVNSFEYDFDTDVLNFNITIVGENMIPYSKVFINNKGAGNKFRSIFNDEADSYDMEIVSLRQIFGQDVNPDNYLNYMEQAKEKSITITELWLKEHGYSNCLCVSSLYQY